MKNYYVAFAVIGVIIAGVIFWRFTLSPAEEGTLAEEEKMSDTSGVPAPSGGGKTSPSQGGTSVTQGQQGRVLFAVSDTAVPLDTVRSILLTVNEVQVHSATRGWVTVSVTPRQYDLIQLRDAATVSELFADVRLDVGMYQQVRLVVDNVIVVTKDGVSHLAVLPSRELKFAGNLVVAKGENSFVNFDFLADKSLHLTGSGTYIFAPVVAVEMRSSVDTVQIIPDPATFRHGRVTAAGGRADLSITLGMDEKGTLKANYRIDPSARLEIEGNVIQVLPRQ